MAIVGALDFGSSKVSPGLEIAGVVSQVGDKVENVAVGDRVAYFSPLGCFSTNPVVEAAACVKIPENMGFEEAAAATVAYFTVVHALLDVAQLDAGQVSSHSVSWSIAYLPTPFNYPVRCLLADCIVADRVDTLRLRRCWASSIPAVQDDWR